MIRIPKPVLPPENIIAYDRWVEMICNQNNFSYWYERIKDIRGIKVPRSVYYQFTFRDHEKYTPLIYCEAGSKESFLREEFKGKIIKPLLDDFMYSVGQGSCFMKNAVFSNKFNFSTCHVEDLGSADRVLDSLLDLDYAGLVVGAEGYNEVVLREYISPSLSFGCIYNGMVLRPEFRVFYDFDSKRVLYTVNYWDYDYCKDYLSDEDREVFKEAKYWLDTYFSKYCHRVEELVSEAMKDVWLEGKWSIDILMNEDPSSSKDAFYLIDMALAHKSAYWDESKVNKVYEEGNSDLEE